MITPVVILKFEGKSTKNELYKLVLASITEITAIVVNSPDPEIVRDLSLKLKECLALCEIAEAKALFRKGMDGI